PKLEYFFSLGLAVKRAAKCRGGGGLPAALQLPLATLGSPPRPLPPSPSLALPHSSAVPEAGGRILVPVAMATSERGEEPDRTLFVGNLESRVQEEILYELFLQAGPVTKVTICKDKDGKPKAFGFVCFKHTESVPYAIALLNGIRLYGRPIKLQYRFGSSHSVDLNSPCKVMETDVQPPTYRTGEPYGGSPVSPFQMNNGPYQRYSAYQNMMTYLLAQQYAPFNPIGQQFPCYQMATPPPPGFLISPYLNPGQISFDSVYSEIKNHTNNLVKAGRYKRKRTQESSDSDSSMENERKKTRRK
ncbi:splicing regulator RBM11, partial [Sceloporus undulatus]|uniref:splicing regulator RBM11 n=1 Tax=Sceloporus undulatus TaxID=8520 RepID=UPI001C4D2899